jgi:hypothetical protein
MPVVFVDLAGSMRVIAKGNNNFICGELDVPLGIFRDEKSVYDRIIGGCKDIAGPVQVCDFAGTYPAAGGFANNFHVPMMYIEFFAYLFERNGKAARVKNNQLL